MYEHPLSIGIYHLAIDNKVSSRVAHREEATAPSVFALPGQPEIIAYCDIIPSLLDSEISFPNTLTPPPGPLPSLKPGESAGRVKVISI